MLECSFGFRPKRSAHDALQVLIDEAWGGRRWVLESDVANCFEAIPHYRLMSAIEERIVDRHVLKLLRAMLRAGVMQDGAVRRSVTGTPQGGVISPLLCNVYLHRLDRQWARARTWRAGALRRRSRGDVPDAGRGRGGACVAPADAGRAGPCSPRRPRRGSFTCGREARVLTSSASITAGCAPAARRGTSRFLARWPSRQAMQHARDRIRDDDGSRDGCCARSMRSSGKVNAFLRGWAGYFRYGNSARHFDAISAYAAERLALFVAKRHSAQPGASAGRSLPSSRRTASG